jgi:imidazolonepropionase-like amidohydrolase
LFLLTAPQADFSQLNNRNQSPAYLDVAAGKWVTPATIVIDGGLISAINPAELPPVQGHRPARPDGTTRLIDVHTHLSYEIGPGWQYEPVTWSTGEFALRAGKNAQRTLLAGFTTVRELGAPGFVDVATMKAIERGDAIGAYHSSAMR